MKSAAHTYSQFTYTVFGLLQKVQNILQIPTFIGVRQKDSSSVYINDYIRAVKTFNAMYTILYNNYFLRVAFGLMYLLGKKIRAFIDNLELLGFERSCGGLKPSAKHRDKIEQMLVPTSREKLDTFL